MASAVRLNPPPPHPRPRQVSDADKERLKEPLTAVFGRPAPSAAGEPGWSLAAETLFQVPWQAVPELVQQRKVVLDQGWAFVAERDQLALLLRAFDDRLSAALEQTAKYLPRLDEESRLLPILSHLSLSYLSGSAASDYAFGGAGGGEGADDERVVTAGMIDRLARAHFPPCMRHLWAEGEAHHHLKHYARLQLGLFLKGVGLAIDEALAFWRKLFQVGTRMADDKFKKDHVYNIRHSYGLEGGKKNYKPKSCVPHFPPSPPPSFTSLRRESAHPHRPMLTPPFSPQPPPTARSLARPSGASRS